MPVSQRIANQRQRAYERRIEQAKERVPQGMYCYSPSGVVEEVLDASGHTYLKHEIATCPYWKRAGNKRDQQNGYCRLMKSGDWMHHEKGGTMLLFDKVKECGINPREEYDED